jgi:hypothetical protein
MELKGFSRALVGGVTAICTSMSSAHAESVLTRKAWTPSETRAFISASCEFSWGMTTRVAMMAVMEAREATPIRTFASDIFVVFGRKRKEKKKLVAAIATTRELVLGPGAPSLGSVSVAANSHPAVVAES